MNILKVKLSGQRIKYEVMKVSFKDNDLIKARRWKWDNNGSLYYIGNRLDILRDYDTFDCIDAGVAIHPIGEINYEMGNTHGVITMDNVLNAINHKILVSYRRAKEEEGLTLLNADVYDNNIYEYTKYNNVPFFESHIWFTALFYHMIKSKSIVILQIFKII